MDVNSLREPLISGIFPFFKDTKADILKFLLPSSIIGECTICFMVTAQFKLISLDCGHTFCSLCVQSYMILNITDGLVYNLTCPEATCTKKINIENVSSVIPGEYITKYYKFKLRLLLLRNSNLRWCPVPDCDGYDMKSIPKKPLKCTYCDYEYCDKCQGPPHSNRCKPPNHPKLDQWCRKAHTKYCPSCKIIVERLPGSLLMSCPICLYSWCWTCGVGFIEEHNEIKCFLGGSYWNVEWYLIVVGLFAPVLWPFTPVLLSIYYVEIIEEDLEIFFFWSTEDIKSSSLKYLIYLILFILSPFIVILALITLSLCKSYKIIKFCIKPSTPLLKIINYSCTFILFLIMVVIAIAIAIPLTILLSVILCIVGLCLLGVKIVIGVRRVCGGYKFRYNGVSRIKVHSVWED